MTPKLTVVLVGKPTTFTCSSESEVTWTYYGPYPNITNHLVDKYGYVYIPKVTVQNRGIYTCLGYIQLKQQLVPFSSTLVLKVAGMFTL